jgi:hypothetical protein
LTFPAPKSVPVARTLGDDELRKAIQEEQPPAVRQAPNFLTAKAGFARI